jgi:hypothetical protein
MVAKRSFQTFAPENDADMRTSFAGSRSAKQEEPSQMLGYASDERFAHPVGTMPTLSDDAMNHNHLAGAAEWNETPISRRWSAAFHATMG